MFNVPSLSAQQFLSISQRDLANLFAYVCLKDPYTQTLNNSVILVPCGCSFSHSTVSEIFGNAQDLLEHPRRCLNTLCLSPVISYIPNYSLRHMERLIYQIQTHVATIWPVITPVIAQQLALEVPEGDVDPFSFPVGKGGRFECSEPWHVVKDISMTCRKMTFKSVSMDSLLMTIDVIGLRGGRTHISLRCRDSQEQTFENYLTHLQILDDDHYPGFFVAKQPHELKWVLRILANYHSLPESQFAFLRLLVEREGFWPSVEQHMRDGPQGLPPAEQVAAVAAVPLLSQQEVESALGSMLEPITMQNIKEAVALIPCGHSLSHSTALMLFGAAEQGWQTVRGRCSICHYIVINYIPNYSLRHLERCIQRMQISATVITQQILEDVLPPLPFPGLGAHFECSTPWSFTSGSFSKFCKEMRFNSRTPGSLLQSVSVFGKHDGGIEIAFTWDESHEQVVRDYLASLGFGSSVYRGLFIAELPHELDWALRFLINNNVFPEQDREFLTRLVESREWPSAE